MEKVQYFWNVANETFAGCKFGEDVTEYFHNDKSRMEAYLSHGKITTSVPVSFDHGKENELNAVKNSLKTAEQKITELEVEAKKGGSTKPSKKVKDLEAELGTANATIKKLEADLEEATKPGKK